LIAPLFVLDEPQPHRLKAGEVHRVRGAALAVEGPPLETLAILRDGVAIAETPIDKPCPELAVLPLPRAAHSRFELDVRLDAGTEYEFRSGPATLFRYFVSSESLRRMREVTAAVTALPMPPPELVATTQGGSDVTSYIDSAVSGFFTIERLLADTNANAILDIGCGTGRLLLGWHAAGRRCAGVDINPMLIEWNRTHLGEVADWRTNDVLPPLPFDNATFDVIQLASVFTHLPLAHQKAWLVELRRLLRPGGAAIVTLHGELYARMLLHDEGRAELARSGYTEVAGADPGANAFATYHTRAFAEELFSDFGAIEYFPRGNAASRASMFPIAALQDVYVLQSPRTPSRKRL